MQGKNPSQTEQERERDVLREQSIEDEREEMEDYLEEQGIQIRQ